MEAFVFKNISNLSRKYLHCMLMVGGSLSRIALYVYFFSQFWRMWEKETAKSLTRLRPMFIRMKEEESLSRVWLKVHS